MKTVNFSRGSWELIDYSVHFFPGAQKTTKNPKKKKKENFLLL